MTSGRAQDAGPGLSSKFNIVNELTGLLSFPSMAARSIGTGTVSFGMVSIPIRLYSAAEPSASISFNLLDGKTKTRLKQQYV